MNEISRDAPARAPGAAPGQAPGAAPVLLCDLDGTLVDSLPDLAAAIDELLEGEGRPGLAPEAVAAMVGDGVPKLIERALAATGGVPGDGELAALVARYLPIYEARMTELTRPYPGAIETLRALKAAGWRLAVCTNKPEAPSRAIVAGLGFEGLFEAISGGDSLPVKKPDPGHLLGLLASLRAAPGAAVMLGDSRNDVLAARAAGLPAVAIAHGYGGTPTRELGADRVIESFAELPAALAALGFAAA
jgi:phosphoglycolate phosphatase